tara:strand:+ start:286 stop:459 length:174 start_codon:yes stop_codon:yes gene_type:complete
MSLIDKVDALWRRIFGADTQPSLANVVEKLLKVGVLRSQRPRPRRLTRLRESECGVS